ncbi:hypothetical protein [Halomonas elongata]|uniref:hypothetical protein n=1 Tax=Halomonas elongata TaxID=2746 RepID=UPI0023B05515|nr:hypothetical protein [Halomonas elongata]
MECSEILEEMNQRMQSIDQQMTKLDEAVANTSRSSRENILIQARYHAQQVNILLDQAYIAHVDATQGKAA